MERQNKVQRPSQHPDPGITGRGYVWMYVKNMNTQTLNSTVTKRTPNKRIYWGQA